MHIQKKKNLNWQPFMKRFYTKWSKWKDKLSLDSLATPNTGKKFVTFCLVHGL